MALLVGYRVKISDLGRLRYICTPDGPNPLNYTGIITRQLPQFGITFPDEFLVSWDNGAVNVYAEGEIIQVSTRI